MVVYLRHAAAVGPAVVVVALLAAKGTQTLSISRLIGSRVAVWGS